MVAKLQVKPQRESRISGGHPWIFTGDVEKVSGNPVSGDEITVVDSHQKFIGRGFYNEKSKIITRIATYEDEKLDVNFFHKRLLKAKDYRSLFLGHREVQRVVYSEADLLPGLIIDRYGDVLVVQTLTYPMEQRKAEIVKLLQQLYNPRIIFEKNDARSRSLEGLELVTGFLYGSDPTPQTIIVDGLTYEVDFVAGQKTGFYLDQKANTRLVRKLAKDKSVLDCFTCSGQFAINAVKGGAKSVIAVDLSRPAITQAARNAAHNNFSEQIQWSTANCFDALANFDKYQAKFDMVILDPPSFCKNRATLAQARRGYKEINLRAMKILKPQGILVTSSCSFHITDDIFLDILRDAAADTKRVFRVLSLAHQDRDHPILLNVPETCYLKLYYLQLI